MYPRGGRVGSVALATHLRTSGSVGIAPRQRGPDPTGALLAFERARPSPEAPTRFGPERGSVHDWWARRVAMARISLKRTPRFRVAPHLAQNGARHGFRAILHGEYALGVLKDLFGFPGRSVRTRGHAPAQGVHPSAVEALGARNADLPRGWSLSTTPSPKLHVPQSARVRAGCPRPVWVGLTSE